MDTMDLDYMLANISNDEPDQTKLTEPHTLTS